MLQCNAKALPPAERRDCLIRWRLGSRVSRLFGRLPGPVHDPSRNLTCVAGTRQKRAKTLSQGSLFDKELAKIDPCPFDIRMRFTDGTGRHDMACGDWETAATFFKWKSSYGEEPALARLKERYEGEYAKAGVAFAFGTMAKHPTTWILLGIIRLDESHQPKLI